MTLAEVAHESAFDLLEPTQRNGLVRIVQLMGVAEEWLTSTMAEKGEMGLSSGGFWERYRSVIEGLASGWGNVGNAAYLFFGDIVRWRKEVEEISQNVSDGELLDWLANATYNPRAAYCLVAMLDRNCVEAVGSLVNFIEAGEILAKMRTLDPEMAVAGPGIESYYARYFWGGLSEDVGVVDGVLRVLAKLSE